MEQAQSFVFILLIILGAGTLGWCLRDWTLRNKSKDSIES